MREPLTTEEVLEMGQVWGDSLFAVLPPVEVLSHYKPDEVFSHYKPADAARFYKPEELMAEYKPEERLSGLSLEEIEAYLQNLKAKKNQS